MKILPISNSCILQQQNNKKNIKFGQGLSVIASSFKTYEKTVSNPSKRRMVREIKAFIDTNRAKLEEFVDKIQKPAMNSADFSQKANQADQAFATLTGLNTKNKDLPGGEYFPNVSLQFKVETGGRPTIQVFNYKREILTHNKPIAVPINIDNNGSIINQSKLLSDMQSVIEKKAEEGTTLAKIQLSSFNEFLTGEKVEPNLIKIWEELGGNEFV